MNHNPNKPKLGQLVSEPSPQSRIVHYKGFPFNGYSFQIWSRVHDKYYHISWIVPESMNDEWHQRFVKDNPVVEKNINLLEDGTLCR